MTTFHALTISQPWAERIAAGEKWVENRTWSTPYRGPLCIHAGSGVQYLTRKMLANYTTGAVVATGDLIACFHVEQITAADEMELIAHGLTAEDVLNHEFTEGPFAWVLSTVRRCAEPYTIPGRQGLWTFDTTEHAAFAF